MIEQRLRDQHAPSWSATTMSFGNTATPPQPIGSPQPTKVSPRPMAARQNHRTRPEVGAKHAFDVAHHAVGNKRGDAAFHHARAQDVAEDAGIGDAHGVDHGNAAFGIASIAVRVEIGDDQDSGVARSSRAGTKRSVTPARQPRLSGPQRFGAAHPDVSQTLLEQHGGDGAVDTRDRVATASGTGTSGMQARKGWIGGRILRARASRQGLA